MSGKIVLGGKISSGNIGKTNFGNNWTLKIGKTILGQIAYSYGWLGLFRGLV